MVSRSIDTKCRYLIACGMLSLYLVQADSSTLERTDITQTVPIASEQNTTTGSSVSTQTVHESHATSVVTISEPTHVVSANTTSTFSTILSPTVSTENMSKTLECTCGIPRIESNNIVTRIVGGSLAEPHSYPWLAILRYYKLSVCGATVINTLYVLTAAHCISMMQDAQKKIDEKYESTLEQTRKDGVVLDRISVLLGAVESVSGAVSGTEEFQVESFLVHPGHTTDELHDTNDLALVRLKRHIQYSTHVQPICLPKQDENFSGFQGVIAGWGHTEFKGTNSRFLRHARVYILDDSTCISSPVGSHFAENPQLFICAYEYKTDTCQGDSGGALLSKSESGAYIQAGIVSWGIECAKEGYPGVYTEVSYYIDWIINNSKDGMFCSNSK